ncbi:MAG: hypothetical protein ACE5NG_03555 [bacterium]
MSLNKLKRKAHNLSFFVHIVLFLSTLSASLSAQPAGIPILTQSHRELTVGISGGYFRKDIDGITYTSPRYLVKGVLGLGGFLDLFAEVGVARVTLEMPDGQANLSSKYQIAYGVGLNVRYFSLPRYRFSLFVSGQMIRFTSNPSSANLRFLADTEVLQVLELKYDWREASLNTGLTKAWGVVNFYLGVNAKIIQRLETKIDKIVIDEGSESVVRQTGEYLSGLETSPFIGLDFSLPSRLTLSLEVVGRNRSDFAFYLGLSQTGKP